MELKKAPDTYNKISADIASQEFAIDHRFDLVFTKMLAEHIKDAKQFHINVRNLLNAGGLAVHFFPTLYTLPFLVNYLVPEKLSAKLLDIFTPRDNYQWRKFPAYYNWCKGPTRPQIQKFIDLGYEVVEYRGFFGHSKYYDRIRILKKLHQLKTYYLLRRPQPLLTSFAYLVLRKA